MCISKNFSSNSWFLSLRRIKNFRWREASPLDLLSKNSRGFSHRTALHSPECWLTPWEHQIIQCALRFRIRVLSHRLWPHRIQRPRFTRRTRCFFPLLQSSRMPRCQKTSDPTSRRLQLRRVAIGAAHWENPFPRPSSGTRVGYS